MMAWSYEPEPATWAYRTTYLGSASHRDVVISAEHSGARWCSPQAYLETDLATWARIDHPALTSFRPQVEENVRLVADLNSQAG